jgi:hypothetical protein
MPHVLENASVVFATTDISSFVKSVSLPQGVAALDQTTMGNTTQIFYPGLKSWSAEVRVVNNFASGSIDEVVNALGRSVFTVAIKPTATTVTASNPQWSGSAFISAYNPVDGTHGALAESVISLTAASALTRATA